LGCTSRSVWLKASIYCASYASCAALVLVLVVAGLLVPVFVVGLVQPAIVNAAIVTTITAIISLFIILCPFSFSYTYCEGVCLLPLRP